jgi:hypothetical protein
MLAQNCNPVGPVIRILVAGLNFINMQLSGFKYTRNYLVAQYLFRIFIASAVERNCPKPPESQLLTV